MDPNMEKLLVHQTLREVIKNGKNKRKLRKTRTSKIRKHYYTLGLMIRDSLMILGLL